MCKSSIKGSIFAEIVTNIHDINIVTLHFIMTCEPRLLCCSGGNKRVWWKTLLILPLSSVFMNSLAQHFPLCRNYSSLWYIKLQNGCANKHGLCIPSIAVLSWWVGDHKWIDNHQCAINGQNLYQGPGRRRGGRTLHTSLHNTTAKYKSWLSVTRTPLTRERMVSQNNDQDSTDVSRPLSKHETQWSTGWKWAVWTGPPSGEHRE